MLRRLHHEQPESFAFTPGNRAWAEAQITKYPEGRQASAIIPLLWRAQEQEGWLSQPAIEYVADMLGMAYIRALEVATFYFMFQLQPVGAVAHVQICGTTPCMLCGSEDLVGVCREKIAANPHERSADGKFSWEEVECLGACANAPMAQIGKDYYEDLTADRLAWLIDEFAAGRVPAPGPQNGRYASEPEGGLTSLTAYEKDRLPENASLALAAAKQDTLRRIDGSEEPLHAPWRERGANHAPAAPSVQINATPVAIAAAGTTTGDEAPVAGEPATDRAPDAAARKPEMLQGAREGTPDDLKLIKGVGPKLEALLHRLGVYHFDQIARWEAGEVAWMDDNLEGFKGRVSRDGWVAQAKLLAEGNDTEFSARSKKEEG